MPCTSPKVDRRNTVHQLTTVSHREGFLYHPFLRARWLDGNRPAALVGIAALSREKERKNGHFAARNHAFAQFLSPETVHSHGL